LIRAVAILFVGAVLVELIKISLIFFSKGQDNITTVSRMQHETAEHMKKIIIFLGGYIMPEAAALQ
jgi:hypothetical protein